MITCKECKYWNSENGFTGQCDCKKFVYNGCGEASSKDDDLLLYSDYEGYDADVETRKNFGCIHGKRRTDA